jgi:formylglycine-generating enzyme required for sulfatase activity
MGPCARRNNEKKREIQMKFRNTAIYFFILAASAALLAACSSDSGGSAAFTETRLDAYQAVQLPPAAQALRTFIRENPASEALPQKVAELYQGVLAMNNIAALAEFSQEFADFPEGEQAWAEMVKRAGLESRLTFKEGKIGEQYVPGYSESQYSTETVTINGQSHTITQSDRDRVTEGYATDRMGYTAVFQVFNEAKQPYVIKVALSGTSTMSEYHVRDSWGSGKSVGSSSQAQKLRKEMSYLIDAGGDIKDQVVVGETKPTDFTFEVIEMTPVSDKWVAALRKALEGDASLALMEQLLADSRAAAWHDKLQTRFTEAARKQIEVKLATGPRFDPDFESPVKVTLSNRSDSALQLQVKPNFGRGGKVTVAPGKSATVTVTALHVGKESLRVELPAITSAQQPVVVERFDYAQAIAVRKQERQRIAAEEEAERQRIAAERAAERVRKQIEATVPQATVPQLEANMVAIPAGEFLMGSPKGEGMSDERPQHRVHIPAFYMGKHEVTFNEWDACVADKGCDHYPDDKGWGRGNRPVINVSYDDITRQYLPWLNKTTGKTYRLPSEAEWEYAARAGTTTQYWWGDELGKNNASCDGCGSEWDNKKSAPVGNFVANPLGLRDTAGNVWEWTQDCMNSSYNGAPADGSAWQDGDCSQRVVRGGSWFHDGRTLRSTDRYWSTTRSRGSVQGFRLSRSR